MDYTYHLILEDTVATRHLIQYNHSVRY